MVRSKQLNINTTWMFAFDAGLFMFQVIALGSIVFKPF
jgi:hypothetical protein